MVGASLSGYGADQAGADITAGGNYQLANIGQPGASGGKQHRIAVLVIYHIAGDHAVGMAI